MGLIPKKELERLQFYESHTTGWSSAATSIGTTTAAVTDLTTKNATARSLYNAHLAARDASKTATQAFHQAMTPVTAAGSAIIDQIRGKARISGDGIWTLANLPAPPTPTPIPAPGTPTGLKVELREDGLLSLTWKCPNPTGSQGTIYQIERKVDDEATFTYLGGVGGRNFIDGTLPAGSSTIRYKIQAVRSTAVGIPANFVVVIGVGGGGGMSIASVVEATPKKVAA